MIELNKTDGIAVLTMNSPAQCHVGQADAGTDRGILAVERCRNCGSVFFRLGGSPRLFTRLAGLLPSVLPMEWMCAPAKKPTDLDLLITL